MGEGVRRLAARCARRAVPAPEVREIEVRR